MKEAVVQMRGVADPRFNLSSQSVIQRMVREMYINTKQGEHASETPPKEVKAQVSGDVILPGESATESSAEPPAVTSEAISSSQMKELVLAGPQIENKGEAASATEPTKEPELKIEMKKAPTSSELSAMLFGSSSEVCQDLLKSDKLFAVALYKDGLWEKRENTVGRFIFKRAGYEVPYCTQEIKESFLLKLEKMPIGILKTTVAFFRAIMKSMHNNECMVQIFWDTQDKKYFIHIPEQYVAQASIRFLHDKDLQNDARYVWAVDIHSHNTMQAFFSGGDDRDEKSTRIFGVLGSLQNESFGHKWRAGCNGKYYDLNMGDLFDLVKEDVFVISADDLKKVKPMSEMPEELKSSATSYGSSYNTPSSYFSGSGYSGSGGGSSYSPGHYAGHTAGAYTPFGGYRYTPGGSGPTGRDFHHNGGRSSTSPVIHHRPQYSDWGEELGPTYGKITKKQKKINRRLQRVLAKGGGDPIPTFNRHGSFDDRDIPSLGYRTGSGSSARELRDLRNSTVGDGVKGTNGTGLGDYDFVVNMNHPNIQYDAYRSVKKMLTAFMERFKEGPGILIDVDKLHSSRYENGSQLLLEMLDVLVESINKDIQYDVNANTRYEESLGDIVTNMASIISKLQTREKLINAFMSEMRQNSN